MPETNQDYPLVKIDDVPCMQLEFTEGINVMFSLRLIAMYSEVQMSLSACDYASPLMLQIRGCSMAVSYFRTYTHVAKRVQGSFCAMEHQMVRPAANMIRDGRQILQRQNPYTYGLRLQNFQSTFAFPIWLFNARNYGKSKLKKITTIAAPLEVGLPPSFYSTASLVAPYQKPKINFAMVVVFITLQGSAIVFVWAVLLWVLVLVFKNDRFGFPSTSSYEIFDVAFNTRIENSAGSVEDVPGGESEDVLRIMKIARVFLKDK